MRSYSGRVRLETSTGDHLRFIPGELARAMVGSGAASVHNANGRVKSIRLLQCAATHLLRIGEPTGRWGGVRFHRWVNLDCGARIVEHHPRCTY